MKAGIVMDPLESINLKKDSTLMMILELQSRGHEVHFIDHKSLIISPNKTSAFSNKLTVNLNEKKPFFLSEIQEQKLKNFDVLLMRQDPPFDIDYIYNTYILDAAEKEGVLVVNKPSSLRNCNEKVFATLFPQCCTPFLVTSNILSLKNFISEHGDIVVKPLDGMGGSSIYRLQENDSNISVILEDLTQFSRRKIMAQTYIPSILEGDKRILLVNGDPMDAALARIPAKGELRGNLAAGGKAVAKALSDRDRWICSEVAPKLKELGLVFVGIDIIGDYLTEINVTSPTCIQEYKNLCNIDVAKILVDYIEKKLNYD